MQFALILIVDALIARWYIAPRLAALPLQAALTPLLLFHTLRTVGMVFVVPAVVDPKLPILKVKLRPKSLPEDR